MTSLHSDEEKYQSPIVRFGIAFTGVVFILSAPVIGYNVVLHFLESRESVGWPTTSAEIIESEVDERRDTTGKRFFWAKVRYTYQVDAADFVGTNVSRDDNGAASPGHAQEVASHYPLHAKFLAYYKPDNPATAVLEPGTNAWGYFTLTIPLIMLGFGILCLWTAKALRPN